MSDEPTNRTAAQRSVSLFPMHDRIIELAEQVTGLNRSALIQRALEEKYGHLLRAAGIDEEKLARMAAAVRKVGEAQPDEVIAAAIERTNCKHPEPEQAKE